MAWCQQAIIFLCSLLFMIFDLYKFVATINKKENNMRIVKVSTESCGMCKVLDQRLHDANITYESVDASENTDFVQRYRIMNVPVTLVLDENGCVVERFQGLFDVDNLKKYL